MWWSASSSATAVRLYCTVVFFAPEGGLGKHRKLMPTALERLVWGFGDGSTLPVVDTPLGQDRRGDLLGKLHASLAHGHVPAGVAIYCAPTADDRDTWASTMTHIAMEGSPLRAPSACQHLRRKPVP